MKRPAPAMPLRSIRLPWIIILIFGLAALVGVAQSQASPDQPVHFNPKLFLAPVQTNAPDVDMPGAALARKESGVCEVSLVVAANGTTRDHRILRCSDHIFAENTLWAIKHYRFKPARTLAENKPVPVILSFAVAFRFPGSDAGNVVPQPLFGLAFSSPQGADSVSTAADRVYPLSAQMQKPRLLQFVDKGFRRDAMPFPDNTGCDVLLTIDATGRASNGEMSSCDDRGMEQSAIESLLQSKYAPATLNGTPVPVRAMVRLTYEGYGPAKR